MTKTLKHFTSTLCLVGLASLAGACTSRNYGGTDPTPGDLLAMESKDALSKRPDRFYLAYMESNERIPGGTDDERVGNEFLFGVGCRKEDPEKGTIVDVPANFRARPSETVRVALNERVALHQFPEAKNQNKLKKNECMVLFGDPDVRQSIQNTPQNYSKGDKRNVLLQVMYTVSTCAGAMFSWGSFMSALGNAAASQGPVGLPILSWWTGSGTVFCGVNLKFLYQSIESYKSQENKALFYEALYKAEMFADGTLFGYTYADIMTYRSDRKKKLLGSQFKTDPENESEVLSAPKETLHSGLKCASKAHPSCERYLKAIDDKNWQLAAAIYNKIFVHSFNRFVQSTFEQGWGVDPKNTRFFDAVRSVQLEFARAQAKNFQSIPGFKAENFSDVEGQ